MLCKFKDIFGKPKTGVHRYRLFGIAIVDLLMTIIVAYLISYYLKKSFIIVFLVLFILGICLHRLFCVNTTLDKLIFG